MGTNQTTLLINIRAILRPLKNINVLRIALNNEQSVYYIGKTLELMGIVCLGAALFLGIVNPYGYSETKAMGVEMGFLALGIIVFFIGRLIEKR